MKEVTIKKAGNMYMSHCIELVLKALVLFLTNTTVQVSSLDEIGLFKKPGVFLTVSASARYEKKKDNSTILYDRLLEINWYNWNDRNPEDFIGLYLENPSNMPVNMLMERVAEKVLANASMGRYKTSLKYFRHNLTGNVSPCEDYWVAYIKVNSNYKNFVTVEETRCLQLYPKWMQDIREVIGNKSLHSIMIPGTHNAGSWKYYEEMASENLLVSYVMCQEDSIYEQLIHGIRYLDIRVAHDINTEEIFWVNHDIFKARPLISVLEDVKKFVVETNEIVILDFHRFPVGFNNATAHEKLLIFIHNLLGDYLLTREDQNSNSLNMSLNQIWKTNKTIVIGYAEDTIRSQYKFLWPNVRHRWADTNIQLKLENYLENSIKDIGCKKILWSAMAELTPTIQDILFRSNFGVRGFSEIVNPKLSYWYHREKWYTRSSIVSTDYYLGNDLIHIAYEANRNNVVCK